MTSGHGSAVGALDGRPVRSAAAAAVRRAVRAGRCPVPGHWSPAGELLHTALIRLPLKGVEVALGYGRLLGAQGPVS